MALGCQGVLDARRHFGETLFGDNAMSFEVIEALAESTWINAADGLFQFAEALGAGEQISQNERRPLVANNLHGAGDAANFGLDGGGNRCRFHTLQSIVMGLY